MARTIPTASTGIADTRRPRSHDPKPPAARSARRGACWCDRSSTAFGSPIIALSIADELEAGQQTSSEEFSPLACSLLVCSSLVCSLLVPDPRVEPAVGQVDA